MDYCEHPLLQRYENELEQFKKELLQNKEVWTSLNQILKDLREARRYSLEYAVMIIAEDDIDEDRLSKIEDGSIALPKCLFFSICRVYNFPFSESTLRNVCVSELSSAEDVVQASLLRDGLLYNAKQDFLIRYERVRYYTTR